MKKTLFIITVLLSLGFISCSMPEGYDTDFNAQEYYNVETPVEAFKYSVKSIGASYNNERITYHYVINANKAFTIKCNYKYSINDKNLAVYVPYKGSVSKAVFAMYDPHFDVLEK